MNRVLIRYVAALSGQHPERVTATEVGIAAAVTAVIMAIIAAVIYTVIAL